MDIMKSSHPSDVSPESVNPPEALSLIYHDDIVLVQHPIIYRGNNTESDTMDSRRLLFYNLPPSITTLQVARATAAFGQVVRLDATAPAVRGASDGTMTMLVEFASPRSATVCREVINSICPRFISNTGESYVAGIWVIPTPSFAVSQSTTVPLDRGYTRTISITPVHLDCVWFIICAIAAPQEILDAEYDLAARTLTLELAVVDLAYRTAQDFHSGLFDFLLDCESDEMRVGICVDSIGYGGYTAYMAPDYLHQRFDHEPFNNYWPETYYYVMTQRNLHPRTHPKKRDFSSSEETATDGDSIETASTAATSLHDEPRGRCLFARDASGFKNQKQEQKDLLDGKGEPEITGNWDKFSQNHHTLGLRGWTEYGKIARHRRELSIEQGLATGIVPKCQRNCEFDCRDIKETPRPHGIDKFLAGPQEDLLIDF
ncbi:hypothetical protein NLG97_g8383 [Lecanicillium saksenae]|uniref:Uncharacterized protein n=1 Tax=Lecanicillium saksenae TaxID=468837 RepID=A0ACC1QKG6_9HYPO|nr:hypothetical protein NLG97_g8383 [Lecanicillium saksenae]